MSDPRQLLSDPLALARHYIATLDPRLDYLANNGDVILVLAREVERVTSSADKVKRDSASAFSWMRANLPEMECRNDEDCDHCFGLQVINDWPIGWEEEYKSLLKKAEEEAAEARRRLALAEAVCDAVPWALSDPEDRFSGPDFPELRELHARYLVYRAALSVNDGAKPR